MLGNLGNLANLMKSAKEMQEQLGKIQEESASRRFEADAGGGMVRATVDGKGMLVDIKIEPTATSDTELLEDLVKSAVGAAAKKAHESLKNEMGSIASGLNIPGLQEMLGG